MGSQVKAGGSWRDLSTVQAKAGGSWRDVQEISVKDGGSWRSAWVAEVTETFAFSSGQTYYGSGTKRSDTRGNGALVWGDSLPTWDDMRGLWVPGSGSESGTAIQTALSGRTVSSFKLTLDLSWTKYGHFNGDGVESKVGLWGHTSSSTPTTLSNSDTMYHLADLVWYSSSTPSGYIEMGDQTSFGNNPPVDGDRFQQTATDIELYSALTSTAKTKLTDGTIKSFVLRAHDVSDADNSGYTKWMNQSNEPGFTYAPSGTPTPPQSTGTTNNFRLTITHTP
jgi:hypothetical protein